MRLNSIVQILKDRAYLFMPAQMRQNHKKIWFCQHFLREALEDNGPLFETQKYFFTEKVFIYKAKDNNG